MNNSSTEPAAEIQQLLPATPTHGSDAEETAPDDAGLTSEPRPRPRLGMYCHDDHVHFLTLPDDPDELALLPIGLVGDPFADRVHVVRGLDFWIGDHSLENHPPNPNMNTLLDHLLADITSGTYTATHGDRAFVQRLLAAGRPRIAGPCLLLGRDETTNASTGLPETFLDWSQRTAIHAVTDLVQTTSTLGRVDASE
ncbi:hypothetical protein ACFFSW_17635 [Saccharothrix longispora]|uniref:Uncharacterized protein n=1 Tax=Saccharothrix longispora TaxID=33920 RepID=A0ABU1PU05_9PSEU|nr:hypothetical protein [Saccharothrix longispora]MDR6593604.1 hypothetical protein [Saccharothrix longispora]